MNIYVVDSSHFLIEIVDKEKPKGNFKTSPQKHKKEQNKTNIIETQKIQKPKGMQGEGFEPSNPYGTGP